MGVIVRKKKGDSAYWVFINHRGQCKAKRIGDKKAAELVATKIRARLADGDATSLVDPAPEASLRLEVYGKRWLDMDAAQRCKASTYEFYEANLRLHVYPVIGTKLLNQLTRSDCRQLVASCRAKGLKRATIRNVCRTLSAMLSQAVEDEQITANPALRLDKYYSQTDELPKEIESLTAEEAATFLEAAQLHTPSKYPLFLCAMTTGLRLGELAGLQWGDIDFKGRFIVVRRGFVRNRVTTPKNGKTRRVDMSTRLVESLQALRHDRKREAMRKGWGDVPNWVFCNTAGGPLDANNLRSRVLPVVLKKAGLRRINLHCLRHTYASLLIAQGESLAYIRDQLGHSSIQLTVDVYGHLVPGSNREAVDRLDNALNRNLCATKTAESSGAAS